MQICILSSFDDILLRDSGGSVRTYNLAYGLAKLGNEVHIIVPSSASKIERVDGVIVHSIKGFCPEQVLKFFSRLLGVSKATALFFYDPTFLLKAAPFLSKSDIIQMEGAVSAPLMILFASKILKKPTVVDCHDAFQSMRTSFSSAIRKMLEFFLEKTTYRFALSILTVSEHDKMFLRKYGIYRNDIIVIPNGVDTRVFSPLSDKLQIQKQENEKVFYQVIFVGNMEYLPNKEAAQYITSYIAPKILNKIKNVKFVMVGKASSELLVNSPHLIFTGVVKNVAELLSESDIAIAPLFRGSGTRLKILEYLASGLPVITTPIGAEGLDVENGVHLLIEDDMSKLIDKTVDLIKDDELRLRLGRAGRELVTRKYDWLNICKQLNEYYNFLIESNNKCENEVN